MRKSSNGGKQNSVGICLIGEGAFARQHAKALALIEDAEVLAVVGGVPEVTAEFAREFNIPYWTTDLRNGLIQSGVEAAIIATPTPLHARQASEVLQAGKHVLIEIPIADKLADAEKVLALQQETGLVAMAGHLRRFNSSHQWIHHKIMQKELSLQHLVVETYFFRRTNTNALGQERSWTDHLLWHHACHSVDLFLHQSGEVPDQISAMQAPAHPKLGIAMDMSLSMRAASGAMCSISLSFNNEGPFGSWFRYICDNGTYVANHDALTNGYGEPVDVASATAGKNGLEFQDREFISAIQERRQPLASVSSVLDSYRVLHDMERLLDNRRSAL